MLTKQQEQMILETLLKLDSKFESLENQVKANQELLSSQIQALSEKVDSKIEASNEKTDAVIAQQDKRLGVTLVICGWMAALFTALVITIIGIGIKLTFFS